MNKRQARILEDDKVNFVCHICQKRYYAMSLERFDKNRHKATSEAKQYRKETHICKAS